MYIKNLTPHEIHEVKSGKKFAPYGNVARVSVENDFVTYIDGVPVYEQRIGLVKDLPDQLPHVYLIVSTLVRLAVPDRMDVLSPGELVRDGNGKPIGCNGFVRNP